MIRLLAALLALTFAGPAFCQAPAAAAGSDCSRAAEAGTHTFLAMGQCANEEEAQAVVSINSADDASTTYSYEPLCVRGEGIRGDGFYGCGEQMECGQGGHLYYVLAHHPDGTTEPAGDLCFQPSEAPAPAQITDALVLRAFQRIPVPAARMTVQPPGGETLVNLDTIFSTDADRFTRTIGLLGRGVELDIRPTEFRWATGDGTTLVTDWAGRPWREGTPIREFITHRYDDAEKLSTRVDTVWTARYRVNGGPWRDVGGTVTVTGQSFDLVVVSAAPYLSG